MRTRHRGSRHDGARPTANWSRSDIGNTFLKLGLFEQAGGASPVEPSSMLELDAGDDLSTLEDWLPQRCQWLVSTVNNATENRLKSWISCCRPQDEYQRLEHQLVPLTIDVDFPDRVGMDRLVAATAADQLRDPDRRAIIVDAGSAITVDLLSADSAFLGGAILPGINMTARALAANTDLLPEIQAGYADKKPDALGRSTESAIRSGLFWGTVGAVRELVRQLDNLADDDPQIFLSGGAAHLLLDQLQGQVQHFPSLVLSGIASIWSGIEGHEPS